MNFSSQKCYRDLILTGQTPLLIHEDLNWDCLKWSLSDWSKIFQGKSLRFRCGRKRCQKFPVWERQCENIDTSFDDFIRFSDDEAETRDEWRYFDYKHMAECFNLSETSFGSLSWESVGFPEVGAESSTLWIGSSGAHTPCHVDTYGCNIVVQVYGRKRWVLFPFSEINNLQPTRVPYEESSIYSKINFSCFNNLRGTNFINSHTVDLSPGDILFVPPKWWHYVENLTTAISINTWIPRADDDLWRLKEGLVRYFISSVVNNIPCEMKNKILNPNEDSFEGSSQLLEILDFCKKREKSASGQVAESTSSRGDELIDCQAHNHKYVSIPKAHDFMKEEIERHSVNCRLSETSEDVICPENGVENLMTVINAFCHPDVINEVQNKFINI